VLDLNVKIQRALRAVIFIALGIWACELPFDVVCTPPIVLLPTRAVPLALEFVPIFAVEVLDRVTFEKEVIPVHSNLVNGGQQGLVLQVDVPVLILIIYVFIVGRQLR